MHWKQLESSYRFRLPRLQRQSTEWFLILRLIKSRYHLGSRGLQGQALPRATEHEIHPHAGTARKRGGRKCGIRRHYNDRQWSSLRSGFVYQESTRTVLSSRVEPWKHLILAEHLY